MKKKRVEATTDLGLSVLVALISVALAIKFSWESAWLNTELRFEAARLNNTVHAEREILFFNRVPKVSSICDVKVAIVPLLKPPLEYAKLNNIL